MLLRQAVDKLIKRLKKDKEKTVNKLENITNNEIRAVIDEYIHKERDGNRGNSSGAFHRGID